jgi:hypothetical protein
MLSPGEIWPIIAASAAVVFTAGQLVEKVRNGKYVAKDMCLAKHIAQESLEKEKEKQRELRDARIDKNLDRIWKRIDGQNEHQEATE